MRLINNASKDKLRGGFYTPPDIASFILKWGFNGDSNLEILEPSCGDGIFLREIQKNSFKYKNLTAVELIGSEAEKARSIGLPFSQIVVDDFHNYCITSNRRYDLIIGNPPYIRYQYFDKEQQKAANSIFNNAGLSYSKLTNAWVSFVIGSSLLLKKEGKIGFVLPAEILQVSFAKQLRDYLSRFYNKINIISFEKLVFPNIQQEVVLLLCEKNLTDSHLIEHIELKNATELKNLDIRKLKTPHKKIDFKSNKWTFYFLDQTEISFIEHLQSQSIFSKLRDFATVEVGITTGANPFFTVPLSIVHKYHLEKFAKPLVGRSVQVPSAIFTLKDWYKNRDSEAKTHILIFPKKSELAKELGALEYLKLGEEQEIHKGYKNRIRDEWQIIPSIRVSDALYIRRNNIYPKLIINEAGAYTTDTMHRVTVNKNVDIKALTASYYNSISLAFSEICGRSHGGGVLELMPNEVEDILLPFNLKNHTLLQEIDEMIRAKLDILKILEVTNKKILKDNFGFTDREINLATNIWKRLSSRRLNRN
jgi:adenine-specific DNA-methyltransferase